MRVSKSPLFDNNVITGEKKLLENGKGDTPIPNITVLRYQFNPSYLKRKTASKYKGHFDVVCKIQRRQIRKFHEYVH